MPQPFDREDPLQTGPIPSVPALINSFTSEPAERFGRTIDRVPAQQPSAGGGGSTTGDWPLKLVAVDTTNVKVLLGTISGFVPTDVDTDIDVSGTDGTWTFYLHATIAGVSVTAVELIADDTGGAVPTDDGNNSYRLMGYVTVTASLITAVKDSFAWSQSVVTCVADTAPHVWQTGA